MSAHSKRSIEMRTWFVILIAACIFFGLGGVYSLLTSTHQWGIAAAGIMVAYIFLIAYVGIQVARFGLIKSANFGALVGLFLAAFYLAGELIVAGLIEQVSIWQWYGGRWNDGYELFGAGSFAIKGFLWAVAYSLRILLILFVLPTAMLSEGERQFCELCKSSTTKTRWKSVVKSFDPAVLVGVSDLRSLMMLGGGSGGERGVWLRVRTCKCASLGELTVDQYKIEAEQRGDTIMKDSPISPIGLCRLVEWVRATDGSAELPGSDLDLEQFGANRQMFDLPLKPAGNEWESLHRWNGSGMGMEWGCDTEYTRAMRVLVGKGDFRAIEESLAMAEDINDIACIYEAGADWYDPQDWIGLWCDEQPGSSVAHTVAGINHVKRAWLERGGGWTPKHVPEFMGLLNLAMESFDRATAIDPENATAHAWKIYAGKGLGQEDERVRLYFDAATRSHPDFHAAHWMYFDYLTAKWYGSEEQCIGFAREVLKNRAAGSAALGVVAYAHFEIARERMEKDKKAGFMGYLNQPEVRSDIVRANDLAFTDHRMSMVTPRVRAFFAYMLWQLGETQGAKAHMEIIGKTTPWDPFSASVFFLSKETYTKARKACGL
ncbi:hypothetical protein COB72_11455 [bacterium]|nr:MAG: hypothetical protein COB72_11455 [bacterium]